MGSQEHRLYKDRYFLVFYDKHDEELLYLFDNVRQILKFMGKEITRQNVNVVNNELYRAFRRTGNFTRFLTGETMRVYMIADVDSNDD